jgi:hypothetical protein
MDTTKNYNFEKYLLVLSNLQRYTMVCCCGVWNHCSPYYTADETATTTDEEDQQTLFFFTMNSCVAPKSCIQLKWFQPDSAMTHTQDTSFPEQQNYLFLALFG